MNRIGALLERQRKLRDRIYLKQLQARTQRRDFSIICNNCWGGMIYQDLGLEYLTPFVGLFLYPDCYLRLLKNLREIVMSPLQFVDVSKYSIANAMRAEDERYPIGLLNEEIELHFVHYSKEDALSCWNRRRKRINWDCLRVAFVQRELCTTNHIRFFNELNYPGKVCLSSIRQSYYESVVCIRECVGKPYVTDLVKYPELYRKYIDIAQWINTGHVGTGFCYRALYPLMNGGINDYRKSREVFISEEDIISFDSTFGLDQINSHNK